MAERAGRVLPIATVLAVALLAGGVVASLPVGGTESVGLARDTTVGGGTAGEAVVDRWGASDGYRNADDLAVAIERQAGDAFTSATDAGHGWRGTDGDPRPKAAPGSAPAQNDEMLSQDDETLSQDDETPSQSDETPSQDDKTLSQDNETFSQSDETPSQSDETPAPPHVRPSEGGAGEEAAVASWLERRLGRSLSSGAAHIDRGEYEQAQAVLGEEYSERLDQYVEVTGDSTAGDDDATGDSDDADDTTDRYQRVAQRQRTLAERLESYERTRASYEAARRNGSREGARTAARDLQTGARQIRDTGTALRGNYRSLGNRTGVDFGNATEAVNHTVDSVVSETEAIANGTFVATRLTADADSVRIAYDAPTTVRGRLTTTEGEPIPNATIAVLDPAGATTTRTGPDGQFAVEHRPVFIPANASALVVAYRPDLTDEYRRARTSIPVDVEQIETAIETSGGESTASFGEQIAVEAGVTAAGRPVAGVPIVGTIADARGTATTRADGPADVVVTVDGSVPAGTQSLRLEPAATGRAVAVDPAEISVGITSTPTALTVAAAPGEDASSLVVSGRLQTRAGLPVAGRVVSIAVGDRPETTVRTGADGRFRTTSPVDRETGTTTIRATFAGTGSNLQSSTAETDVDPSVGTAGRTDGTGWIESLGIDGVIDAVADAPLWLPPFALVAVAVPGFWAVRRWRTRRGSPDRDPTALSDTGRAVDAPGDGDSLATVRQLVDTDPAGATKLAYGTARTALDAEVSVGPGATHREFLAAGRRTDLDGEAVSALFTLTERYETAAFRPDAVDEQTARDALVAAEVLT